MNYQMCHNIIIIGIIVFISQGFRLIDNLQNLLFDRQGNLVDRNAPRPDSEEIRDKIDSLLEVM